MTIRIIRTLFILACVIMGTIWANYIVGTYNLNVNPIKWMVLGGAIGCAISIIVLFLLKFITQEIFETMAPAFILIVLAMVAGYGISKYIHLYWTPQDPTLSFFLTTTLVLVFGFCGISLGLTRASLWESVVSSLRRHDVSEKNLKIVDTSVIIDGRISDICKTGFIEGTLVIPRFILKELQNIADSADVLRRAKGRRGLDILKLLQNLESGVEVMVVEDDPRDVREVDGKLVRLAKNYNAKILTNDFNLNKVAQIEGVGVLNINDLANALKPAVLPDESMEVKIIKEGKEPLQGVGYLDDGTMVVVDGGKHHVGSTVGVVVTSVLQTAAGRMIFGKVSSVIS